jgi:hypothetical protein
MGTERTCAVNQFCCMGAPIHGPAVQVNPAQHMLSKATQLTIHQASRVQGRLRTAAVSKGKLTTSSSLWSAPVAMQTVGHVTLL